MQPKQNSFSLFLVLIFTSLPLFAVGPVLKHEAVIPPNTDFIRSLDVDAWVERLNYDGSGAQSGRVRLRFLDPDVNAFVGMVAGLHHSNLDFVIGEPANPSSSGYMVNWGGLFGIVRGSHLWELDLMGSNLGPRLGAAVGFVGEHKLSKYWILYHRTEFNVYTVDAVMDADQGFYWMCSKTVGVSLGYRWLTSSHMDRSGPHVGIRIYFESPKIPFIFPSLG